MKKLISAENIEQAVAQGQMRIEISLRDTIVTPQAQSLAEKAGVELIVKDNNTTISHSDMQKIIAEVQKQLPGGKFSRARIQKAVKDVTRSGKMS